MRQGGALEEGRGRLGQGGRLGKQQTSVKWLPYVPATDGNNQGLNFSITEQNNPKDNRNVKPTKTSQKSLYPIILIQIS